MHVKLDRADLFPRYPSLRIDRLDGGFVVATPALPPSACRTEAEVLDCVRLFTSADRLAPKWSGVREGHCVPGMHLLMSKIDGGYMATLVDRTGASVQFVRFEPSEMVALTSNWLGLIELKLTVKSAESGPGDVHG